MNLQQKYAQQVVPKLQTELGLGNLMAVPRVIKVTLNCSLKAALTDRKVLENAGEQFTLISGQKPVVTRAKKSIAAFKLRQGQPIGLMVTLRGRRMYDFLEKLVTVVLPRTKDFHGLSLGSLDEQGNFSLGVAETSVFPEIDVGKVEKTYPLQVTVTTTARSKGPGEALFRALGWPFKKIVKD